MSQEIPGILPKPKVHYRVHNILPRVPVPSKVNPVQAPPTYFLNIHFNITLPSKRVSQVDSFYHNVPPISFFFI